MNITPENPYRNNVYEQAEQWRPNHAPDREILDTIGASLQDVLLHLKQEGVPENAAYWAGKFICARTFTLMQTIKTEQNIQALQGGALQNDYEATEREARVALRSQYIRRRQLGRDIARQDDKLHELRTYFKEGSIDPMQLAVDSIAEVYAQYRPVHQPTDAEADVWTRESRFSHAMRTTMLQFFSDTIDGTLEFVGHYGTLSSLQQRLPARNEHITLSEAKRAFREARAFRYDCDHGYHKFEGIISSPLQRAKDTARILARVFGFKEEDIVILPELAERRYGKKFIHTLYREIEALAGEGNSLTTVVNDKHVLIDKAMETPYALYRRALRVGAELIRLCKNKNMIVVGHRSMERALLQVLNPQYLQFRKEFAEMIQSPPILKPGARITLGLSTMTDSLDELFGMEPYVPKRRAKDADPLLGTPVDQKLRHIYQQTIRETNFTGPDLLDGRRYYWQCPALHLSANLPSGKRFISVTQDKLEIGFRDPQTQHRILEITQLSWDYYRIQINHKYRHLFPELRNVPLPAPDTQYAGGLYSHSWSYGWEEFYGPSRTFPRSIQALRDRLVLIASEMTDDIFAGKDYREVEDRYSRCIFGPNKQAEKTTAA